MPTLFFIVFVQNIPVNMLLNSLNLSCKANNVAALRNMAILAKSLKYNNHGEPEQVLKIVEHQIEEPKDNEVLVKVLSAPINPADINTIQGE